MRYQWKKLSLSQKMKIMRFHQRISMNHPKNIREI